MHTILNEKSLTPKREQELLEIMKATHIPGSMAYHYERSTGYAPFANTQGTSFQIFQAVENNHLLGFTQITFDQVVWNGKSTSIAYSGDTRVSSQARGRKISDALIQAACNQSVPVFGAVLGSNKIVLDKKIADWKKSGINFKEVADAKILFFRPAKIKAPTSRLHFKTAESADLRAMYFLWKHHTKRTNLARSYTNLEAFSRAYESTPGVSLSSTLLVYDGVTLVGMLSIWDQTAIRQMVVDEKNILIKIASRFIALPEEGEQLKTFFSFQHAFMESHPHCTTALQTLIAKARMMSLESDAHFFCMGLDSKDPLYAAIQNTALFQNSVKLILDSRGHSQFESSHLPFHLEVGMG